MTRDASNGKRMRDSTHSSGDGPLPLVFPRRFLYLLFAGAGIYAGYRMVQTTFAGELRISTFERLGVALADGVIMAMLAPVALWASRRFPIVAPFRARNVTIHLAIALLASAAWIVG